MDAIDDDTLQFLIAAGWKKGRIIDVSQLNLPSEPFHAALNVLQEFGNLIIGAEGRGFECARASVSICPYSRLANTAVISAFEDFLQTKLFHIGQADNDNSILFIDPKGEVYLVFDGPLRKTVEMQRIDLTFGHALKRLLLGYHALGPSLLCTTDGDKHTVTRT